jgi:hypothetical protein
MDPKADSQTPPPGGPRTGGPTRAGPAVGAPEAADAPDAGESWPAPCSEVLNSPGGNPQDALRLEGEPIGAYLAAQRRLRGITVEELAAQTRIPLRSLERLEAGCFDANIDGFVRGFVRTVAEALGLDPEESVARTRSEPRDDFDAGPGPHLSLRRVFLTVAFIVAAGLLLGLVQTVAISTQGGSSSALDPVVIRRDPVAALAEAQAVAALSPVLRVRARGPQVASEQRKQQPEAASRGPELSQPAARSR